MKESVKTSLGWIRANANNYYKLDENEKEIFFDKVDIHIHFPAASVPKVLYFFLFLGWAICRDNNYYRFSLIDYRNENKI